MHKIGNASISNSPTITKKTLPVVSAMQMVFYYRSELCVGFLKWLCLLLLLVFVPSLCFAAVFWVGLNFISLQSLIGTVNSSTFSTANWEHENSLTRNLYRNSNEFANDCQMDAISNNKNSYCKYYIRQNNGQCYSICGELVCVHVGPLESIFARIIRTKNRFEEQFCIDCLVGKQ